MELKKSVQNWHKFTRKGCFYDFVTSHRTILAFVVGTPSRLAHLVGMRHSTLRNRSSCCIHDGRRLVYLEHHHFVTDALPMAVRRNLAPRSREPVLHALRILLLPCLNLMWAQDLVNLLPDGTAMLFKTYLVLVVLPVHTVHTAWARRLPLRPCASLV